MPASSQASQADALAQAGQALHGTGHGWIKAWSADLGVHYDSLRQMMRGKRPVPPGVTARATEILARRAAHPVIPPPPTTLRVEDDRDAAAGEAIGPALAILAAAAEGAGWHPAEVAAAILSWCVHRVAEGAGDDAARQSLLDAIEMLAMRRSG
jgi:hypothetical protein